MASFEPFQGIRYDPDAVDLTAVVAPPYDVIDEAEREVLGARHPANVTHVDLPRDEPGEGRYEVAARTFREWRDRGPLLTDPEPSFYGYRMGYHDEAGRPRQTSGFIGALGLDPAAEPAVLPHEETTPKARSDRLQLMQACRADLSPIWALSPTEGLGALAETAEPPLARWTDDQGVHHRLWRVTRPAVVEAISSAVEAAPVLVADGHHRYRTALTYREERRAAEGPGPWDSLMTYVVELAEDQLEVRPIHRLLRGLPDDVDLPGALERWFEVAEAGAFDAEIVERLVDEGALGLVVPGGRYLLRPRPELLAAAVDLDSSRLDVALADLGDHELTFHHDLAEVQRLVETGSAQAGVLLRPATVAQIAETAHGGRLMPTKTTYFHPKPTTGVVFRSLEA